MSPKIQDAMMVCNEGWLMRQEMHTEFWTANFLQKDHSADQVERKISWIRISAEGIWRIVSG